MPRLVTRPPRQINVQRSVRLGKCHSWSLGNLNYPDIFALDTEIESRKENCPAMSVLSVFLMIQYLLL